ncbi:MAG: histidinol dehydrogenase [Alphaproteobacteria bacterium]|nr:histidinol dehydrogenase [Alphaproteobacteria bacterium]
MSAAVLRPVALSTLLDARRDPVDAETVAIAAAIVDDVRGGGEPALRRHAERLGDLAPGAPLVLGPDAMARAAASLPGDDLALLERVAGRIRAFATAQRAALAPLQVPIPGGSAGLRYHPVDRAGCYAPGGRYPLPSSVLMTAVTARAAGVGEVWVASPRPTAVTLAAAHVAGADQVLAVGGAQAIAALTFGAGGVPACGAIAGPGNRFVTAAKQQVSGRVAIDMLAGPSELVVLATGGADPRLVAADLLAQAEHDPDAVPVLVTPDAALAAAVDAAVVAQLADLPTRDIARAALDNGGAVVVADLDAAVAACNALAPEHLALHGAAAEAVSERLHHYGGLFVGEGAAEVLGDYGAGPNHTLPTGGTARSFGALSVLCFLRVQTSLHVHDRHAAAALARDAARLGRLEGLEAHARSADRRS